MERRWRAKERKRTKTGREIMEGKKIEGAEEREGKK